MFAKDFRHTALVSEDWARLAEAVKIWRQERHLSQDRIRAQGGPSDVVLGRIERNEEPHPRGDTLHKLDAGMGWTPGSASRILRGGDPAPEKPTELDLTEASDDELLAELCRRLAMRHDQPQYPVPISLTRSPYSCEQYTGVGGDEQGDQPHKLPG